MIRLLLSIITTAIALFFVTRIVPGISVSPADDPWAFIWVAVLFKARLFLLAVLPESENQP